MKQKSVLRKWLPAFMAGMAFAGSGAFAAPGVTNNFNSADSITDWSLEAANLLAWDATAGVDGSGAMKVTLKATDPANREVNLFWFLGDNAISSADYVTVEYDLLLDPASGVDANSAYGNWQEVLRDASWSWDSHWVGALNSGHMAWTRMKFAVPNVAKTFTRLGFQLQGTAPYSGDLTYYIDNLVILPYENPLVLATFADAAESAAWTAGGLATLSHAALDADGSASSGSLKVEAAYNPDNTGWQESFAIYNFPFSPARYTYLAFDVYLENPNNLTGFGIANMFTLGWKNMGTVNFNANNVGKWTHYELPIPAGTDFQSADGLRIQLGGGMTAPLIYYIDNIRLYKPITAPTIGLTKAGSAGVQITMDDNASQWQREAISTPAEADATSFFWTWQSFPVTYSFTISGFPEQAKHPGYEAHMYIVNGDTVSGNQTYGGADWNAADIFMFRVENGNAGGVVARIDWKTNLPAANPPADAVYHPVNVTGPTAIGTWTLTFTDQTHGTVTGPGIDPVAFTMPEDVVYSNFSPSRSFMQFGFFKNDGANDGHNNQASGTFSAVRFTGLTFPFDDKFDGTSLTSNYAWRVTRSSAVAFVPPGTGWWVNWTLPADGYFVESAPAIDGPWGDAGLTSTNQSGAMMFGPVPTSALPSTEATFFRLTKP